MKTRTVPVSMRALKQRVSRKLKDKGPTWWLSTPRGECARQEYGDFMILDGNLIKDWGTTKELVSRAREMGCLGDHEELVS